MISDCSEAAQSLLSEYAARFPAPTVPGAIAEGTATPRDRDEALDTGFLRMLARDPADFRGISGSFEVRRQVARHVAPLSLQNPRLRPLLGEILDPIEFSHSLLMPVENGTERPPAGPEWEHWVLGQIREQSDELSLQFLMDAIRGAAESGYAYSADFQQSLFNVLVPAPFRAVPGEAACAISFTNWLSAAGAPPTVSTRPPLLMSGEISGYRDGPSTRYTFR